MLTHNPFGETRSGFVDFLRLAMGEVKAHCAETEVWGEGKCPMCQRFITAHIDFSEYKKEGIVFSNDQMTEAVVKFMTKSHRSKCQAIIVKPYDGRFNVLRRNEKGEWVVPIEEWHRIDARDLD